jgi:hypothetical protein
VTRGVLFSVPPGRGTVKACARGAVTGGGQGKGRGGGRSKYRNSNPKPRKVPEITLGDGVLAGDVKITMASSRPFEMVSYNRVRYGSDYLGWMGTWQLQVLHLDCSHE